METIWESDTQSYHTGMSCIQKSDIDYSMIISSNRETRSNLSMRSFTFPRNLSASLSLLCGIQTHTGDCLQFWVCNCVITSKEA